MQVRKMRANTATYIPAKPVPHTRFARRHEPAENTPHSIANWASVARTTKATRSRTHLQTKMLITTCCHATCP